MTPNCTLAPAAGCCLGRHDSEAGCLESEKHFLHRWDLTRDKKKKKIRFCWVLCLLRVDDVLKVGWWVTELTMIIEDYAFGCRFSSRIRLSSERSSSFYYSLLLSTSTWSSLQGIPSSQSRMWSIELALERKKIQYYHRFLSVMIYSCAACSLKWNPYFCNF